MLPLIKSTPGADLVVENTLSTTLQNEQKHLLELISQDKYAEFSCFVAEHKDSLSSYRFFFSQDEGDQSLGLLHYLLLINNVKEEYLTLLFSYKDLFKFSDEHGQSVLHLAIKQSRTDIFNSLLNEMISCLGDVFYLLLNKQEQGQSSLEIMLENGDGFYFSSLIKNIYLRQESNFNSDCLTRLLTEKIKDKTVFQLILEKKLGYIDVDMARGSVSLMELIVPFISKNEVKNILLHLQDDNFSGNQSWLHLCTKNTNQYLLYNVARKINPCKFMEKTSQGNTCLHLAAMQYPAHIPIILKAMAKSNSQQEISSLLEQENNDKILCIDLLNTPSDASLTHGERFILGGGLVWHSIIPYLTEKLIASVKKIITFEEVAFNCLSWVTENERKIPQLIGVADAKSQVTKIKDALNMAKNFSFSSVLHETVKMNHHSAFLFFYEFFFDGRFIGVNLNPEKELTLLLEQKDEHGNSLLHQAVFQHNIFDCIFKQTPWFRPIYSKINLKNEQGVTPISLICAKVEILYLDKGKNKNEIMYCLALIKKLLSLGASWEDLGDKNKFIYKQMLKCQQEITINFHNHLVYLVQSRSIGALKHLIENTYPDIKELKIKVGADEQSLESYCQQLQQGVCFTKAASDIKNLIDKGFLSSLNEYLLMREDSHKAAFKVEISGIKIPLKFSRLYNCKEKINLPLSHYLFGRKLTNLKQDSPEIAPLKQLLEVQSSWFFIRDPLGLNLFHILAAQYDDLTIKALLPQLLLTQLPVLLEDSLQGYCPLEVAFFSGNLKTLEQLLSYFDIYMKQITGNIKGERFYLVLNRLNEAIKNQLDSALAQAASEQQSLDDLSDEQRTKLQLLLNKIKDIKSRLNAGSAQV